MYSNKKSLSFVKKITVYWLLFFMTFGNVALAETVNIFIIDTGSADIPETENVTKSTIFADEITSSVPLDGDWTDDHGSLMAVGASNEADKLGADVKITSMKAMSDGYYDGGDIADAIRKSVDEGADIISLSLGSVYTNPDGTYSQDRDSRIDDALDYAQENGVVVIAAAGNSPVKPTSFPANRDDVLAVAQAENDDSKTPHDYTSQRDDDGKIGYDFITNGQYYEDDGYWKDGGSSLATARFSAKVAEIMNEPIEYPYDVDGDGEWSPSEVKQKLENTVFYDPDYNTKEKILESDLADQGYSDVDYDGVWENSDGDEVVFSERFSTGIADDAPDIYDPPTWWESVVNFFGGSETGLNSRLDNGTEYGDNPAYEGDDYFNAVTGEFKTTQDYDLPFILENGVAFGVEDGFLIFENDVNFAIDEVMNADGDSGFVFVDSDGNIVDDTSFIVGEDGDTFIFDNGTDFVLNDDSFILDSGTVFEVSDSGTDGALVFADETGTVVDDSSFSVDSTDGDGFIFDDGTGFVVDSDSLAFDNGVTFDVAESATDGFVLSDDTGTIVDGAYFTIDTVDDEGFVFTDGTEFTVSGESLVFDSGITFDVAEASIDGFVFIDGTGTIVDGAYFTISIADGLGFVLPSGYGFVSSDLGLVMDDGSALIIDDSQGLIFENPIYAMEDNTVSDDTNNTNEIVFNNATVVHIGAHTINIPSGLVMTTESPVNFSGLGSTAVDLSSMPTTDDIVGSVGYGLGDNAIALSSGVITVDLNVGADHDGETLTTYHKSPYNVWTVAGSCNVVGETCSFTTSDLSSFAASAVPIGDCASSEGISGTCKPPSTCYPPNSSYAAPECLDSKICCFNATVPPVDDVPPADDVPPTEYDDPVPVPTGSGVGGLVPCGGTTGDPCGFDHFIIIIGNFIEFILLYIALPLAASILMYAGFLMMTARGNPGKILLAKKAFNYVFIGLFVAFAAWLIVEALMKGLGLQDEFWLLG